MKKKKLDIFNLFYSGAAVVILVGVIAKLLEWPAQDLLITLGLSIEALVFGVSAFKFVEVEEKQVGATEATLAKVADGLGSLSGSTNDTFINIQAPADAISTDSNNTNIGLATFPLEASNTKNKVSIDINNTSHDSAVPPTHTLWQLEQMDILSLSKELFYQPAWNTLSVEAYSQLGQLFKILFDKKIPNKEALPFLKQFPVKLPVPEISELILVNQTTLMASDIELLCNAFDIIKVASLLEYFVIEAKDTEFIIRTKLVKETMIFGGEQDEILAHCKKFYGELLIASPNMDCLKPYIKLKDQVLIDYLIQKVDVKNETEFVSLAAIINKKQDDTKKKVFSKFKKIKYVFSNEDGYVYLKTLAQLALSFLDQALGQELFKKVLEVQIDDTTLITLDDVINCYSDTMYFGPKNEYSVVLNEIFINGELNNLTFVNSIVEKLVTDGVANKSKLLEVFNLKEQDSKKDVFTKLNYHLTKSNTAPSGAQLAFILLYKQYS